MNSCSVYDGGPELEPTSVITFINQKAMFFYIACRLLKYKNVAMDKQLYTKPSHFKYCPGLMRGSRIQYLSAILMVKILPGTDLPLS